MLIIGLLLYYPANFFRTSNSIGWFILFFVGKLLFVLGLLFAAIIVLGYIFDKKLKNNRFMFDFFGIGPELKK